MAILFSNSSPKILKSGIFGPKLKEFYFSTKLCNKANSRRLVSNMTIAFSNSSLNTCKLGVFLIPNLRIFILHQTLQLGKFEGVDFKYDHYFFEFQPSKAYFVLNISSYFIFAWNFAYSRVYSKFDFCFVLHIFFNFRQILGCWFPVSQSFFQVCNLKITRSTFWSQI